MDFKLCYENLGKHSDNNSGYDKILKDIVVGANQYHEDTERGNNAELSGIRADGNILTIELIKPQNLETSTVWRIFGSSNVTVSAKSKPPSTV